MLKTPLPPSCYERHKCGLVICQSPVDYFVVCNYCQLNIRFDDFKSHFRIEHYAQLMQLTQPQNGPTEDPLIVRDDNDDNQEEKEKQDYDSTNHEMLVDVTVLKEEQDSSKEDWNDDNNSLFNDNESSEDNFEPNETTRFPCDQCGKALKSKKGLMLHKKRLHKAAKDSDTSYDSDASSTTNDTDDRPLKRKRIRQTTSKSVNFECPHCEKHFPAEVNLFAHISLVHNPTKLQDAVVKVAADVVVPKLEIPDEPLKQLEEQEQQDSQEQQDETEKPESVSSSSTKKTSKCRKFDCEQCNESFPREKLLTYHILSVHNNNSCDVCGKTYKSTNTLIDHRLTHTGDKRFKCKDCDESFCSNGELRTHRQRHRPIKMCVCHVCGMECVKNAYQRHMRRHTGERPFKCRVCGKGFFEGFDRNVHESKHYEDKSFFCDICGGTYPHKKALRVHRKTHITERNVCCSICFKGFINERGLKEHMRMHTKTDSLVKKENQLQVIE